MLLLLLLSPQDGGKWLCMPLDYLLPEGPCNIYSFGSNNDYSFEQAILNRTKCNVFTVRGDWWWGRAMPSPRLRMGAR